MASYRFGERVSRDGKLMLSTSVVIFDESHTHVLLTRRSDNGRWCLPGGHMEAGESVIEACARETREETGLRIHVARLIGVYSNPHMLLSYADGNQFHMVNLCFEGIVTEGMPSLSDETTEIGYFTPQEIEHMDIVEPHRERITDAMASNQTPMIR
ncbi:NUDIX domain-containing protein [Ktedonospora formicarum]|uniref:NUDIX hydrolase n=1 Tax=Ktedonospora formicarum TaxID=2778364 RepID=A0A8J3HYX3_9CHLR|nr:NUDIX domain-containing protein [Ktedonospora formicarum]GHO43068.1 NUDIX hydrolase [Ktedonospora formicarum]